MSLFSTKQPPLKVRASQTAGSRGSKSKGVWRVSGFSVVSTVATVAAVGLAIAAPPPEAEAEAAGATRRTKPDWTSSAAIWRRVGCRTQTGAKEMANQPR